MKCIIDGIKYRITFLVGIIGLTIVGLLSKQSAGCVFIAIAERLKQKANKE